jgi:hypothetical protein
MLNIAVIVENITNHNILTLTPLLKPKFPRPPLEIYVLALDSHTNVADINRMRKKHYHKNFLWKMWFLTDLKIPSSLANAPIHSEHEVLSIG